MTVSKLGTLLPLCWSAVTISCGSYVTKQFMQPKLNSNSTEYNWPHETELEATQICMTDLHTGEAKMLQNLISKLQTIPKEPTGDNTIQRHE